MTANSEQSSRQPRISRCLWIANGPAVLPLALVLFASAGLVVTVSSQLALIAVGALLPLYGLIRSVRPMIYVVSFMSTFANVLPLQFLGVRLASGITLGFWDLLLIICIFIPWIIRRLLDRHRFNIPWSRASTMLVLLLALATLSFFHGLGQGANMDWAIFQYRSYVYAFAMLLVACDEIRTSVHVRKMISIWLIGIVLTGLFAAFIAVIWGNVSDVLPNLFTNVGSAGGTMPWRLNYRIGASATLGFAVLLALWLRGQKSNWAIMFGMASMLAFIALSLTRALYACVGLTLCMNLLLVEGTRAKRWLLVIVVPVITASAVLLLSEAVPSLATANVTSSLMSRLSTTFDVQDPNLVGRAAETNAAIYDISQNPILGLGLGMERPSSFWGDLRSITNYRTEWNTYFVHNTFILVALQMGIGGVILLVLYVISCLQIGWNLRHISSAEVEKALVIGITVAVLVEATMALAWPNLMADNVSAIVLPQLLAWLIALRDKVVGLERISAGMPLIEDTLRQSGL